MLGWEWLGGFYVETCNLSPCQCPGNSTVQCLALQSPAYGVTEPSVVNTEISLEIWETEAD